MIKVLLDNVSKPPEKTIVLCSTYHKTMQIPVLSLVFKLIMGYTLVSFHISVKGIRLLYNSDYTNFNLFVGKESLMSSYVNSTHNCQWPTCSATVGFRLSGGNSVIHVCLVCGP